MLQVALPVPLRQVFDYLPPQVCAGVDRHSLKPGIRVVVPFGRQKLTGILLGTAATSELSLEQLRQATAILDVDPCLPEELLAMGRWAADYYHHPLGDVLLGMLPKMLREGGAVWPDMALAWRQIEGSASLLPRVGSRQRDLLDWCQEQGGLFTREQLLSAGFSTSIASALVARGALTKFVPPVSRFPTSACIREAPLSLSEEQRVAVDAVVLGKFGGYLLEGITGSGKTEVYLQLIAKVLERGEQALVLVPEIGLTPQTVDRFRRRFTCPVVVMHSGLADGERLAAWRAAERGEAGIVIGTRSALFTPLPSLGIVIVDEEHDSSFKQHEGFRYSGRDLAVWRANARGVPALLGSATPSLETLHNAIHERYQHLRLTQRAGNASMPLMQVIDVRSQALKEGFSSDLLIAMREELDKGHQVLVFLNRRGYAPALVCADCNWQAACPHCTARLTVHRSAGRLRCHHCDYQLALSNACPTCSSTRLDCVGVGTQRSEQFLVQQFSEYPVIRVDRDSMSRKQSLERALEQVQQGNPCLLVGTQMLAKGHHFPDVTLVAMLDMDHGLFAADFRGPEKMGQLLEQVAGRAGRAEKSGRVLIQSRYAEHPLLTTLMQEGYQRLSRLLLKERQVSALPPYSYLVLLRVEHKDPVRCQRLLGAWREQLSVVSDAHGGLVQVAGPFPALLEKRGDLYRYDLQLKSASRVTLQGVLSVFCDAVDKTKLPAGIRWSIDVDPVG